MDAISEIINNALMQSLILSPLMGVLFAAIFTGLTNSPAQQSPSTIIQTREVYVTKIVERRSSSRNSDDGMGFLVAGGIALLFIIWKYAILFDVIQYYLAVAILTVLSFSVTTILISFVKGHYTSSEWWLYTLGPVLSLVVCIYLLILAKESFDPSIQQGAMNNSFWLFYTKWLNDYGRSFMFAHVGGIALLGFAVLLIALSLIHYLSLMNLRGNGAIQGLWFFMARITSFFSGKSWLFLVVTILALSYICLNPSLAAIWMTKR